MDLKGERKGHHQWLPPNYVSLAQLRERWLKQQREKEMGEKQQEDEMREKQKEEEMREKQPEANENQKLKGVWLEKGEGGRRRKKKGGRERGPTEIADKVKEKEIPMGGFGKKTHYKKKNNNRYSRMEGFKKGNVVEKEKLEIEANNDVNSGRSKEAVSAVKGGNRADYNDGLSRNHENLATDYHTKRENGVRFNQGKEEAEVGSSTDKKMVEKKDYRRNRKRRGENINIGSKVTQADVSEGNVVEKDSENKALHENSEVCSKTGDPKGGNDKDEHVEYHGVKYESINSDPKAKGLVLTMGSLKIDENRGGAGEAFNRGYGNQRRNNGRHFRGGLGSNDWYGKADDFRRYGRFGRFEGHGKSKTGEMNGMKWVRKEDRSNAVDGAP